MCKRYQCYMLVSSGCSIKMYWYIMSRFGKISLKYKVISRTTRPIQGLFVLIECSFYAELKYGNKNLSVEIFLKKLENI